MAEVGKTILDTSQQHLQERLPISSEKQDDQDLTKQAACTAVGAGIAYGIGKGVDSFVRSSGGDSTKSLLGKLVAKIDNWALSSNLYRQIGSRVGNLRDTIVSKHTELLRKPDYKQIVDLLNKGGKTKSMLYGGPLADQLIDQLNKAKTASARALIQDKINIINHVEQNSSFLSRILTKASIGTGNLMGGSIANIIFNGIFLGSSIKQALEAPKGEKLSTLMEDIMGPWIGGFVLMTPASKIINSIGGWKEIGVGSIGKLPLWKKALETIGKVVSSGQGKGFIKGMPGGILRLVLMMALTAPFTNILKKVSHMIFGKPTHRYNKPTNTDPNKVTNMFETARKSSTNTPQQAQPANQAANNQPKKTYDYMPSAEPAVFSAKNTTSEFDKKLKKADTAQKQALDLLKSLK